MLLETQSRSGSLRVLRGDKSAGKCLFHVTHVCLAKRFDASLGRIEMQCHSFTELDDYHVDTVYVLGT